ncbi:flagellar hook-associated protein 3 FlgL [Erwinia toletana]|uniref:Flagellar hook-associated protein 3 FlgL n=1 Tax=Winslowiella toletana TaxID=92490 RepID=A0ABS4PE86_9GAMM|nr:flagellar hook-associated protein FlgL [Winslowiella toletana]MBP2170948.1 flagellar hook-associated protein 3 FlgL [Winslowiella toletana]
MRISTSMMYSQQTKAIIDAQSSWLKAGEQLSSGKRVVNPSDDPIASANAVLLAQTQAQSKQFGLARDFATQNLSLEESTLQNVTSSIISAQSLVVNAGNGTLSDDDRASLATQLEGVRGQLMNLANSTDGNGRYLFAGYKTDAAPFDDSTGTMVYNGGDQAITQQVDASRSMTISHTGKEIFQTLTSTAEAEPDGSASETDLFKMLDDAIAALKVPQDGADETTTDAYTAALGKATRGLANSLNNVLKVRSETGTQLDELEKLDDLSADRDLSYTTQMSNLVDADYTSSISSYTMLQSALQASYSTFSSMSKMSLFQLNS